MSVPPTSFGDALMPGMHPSKLADLLTDGQDSLPIDVLGVRLQRGLENGPFKP